MTKDQALKLALEALQHEEDTGNDDAYKLERDAIKEALAQPEQEPVGDFYITKDMAEHIKKLEVDWTICASGSKRPTEKKVVPVFVGNTTPPQPWEKFCDSNCVWTDHHPDCKLAQPEQEPVAWRALVSKFPQGTGSDWVYVTKPIMKDSVHNQPLYTTPPQRTWVGLTEDEAFACQGRDYFETYKAIEAKLKERNT